LNDRLPPSVPMMTLEFHCATDTGRARSNNEDSAVLDEATSLVVLADGMGGYNAGEVASGMCTSFIKTELGRWLAEASESATDTDVRRAMDICVDNANRAIFNAANSNPQYAGMGTTLVVSVFRDNRLLVGHVGDSRAYLLRDGELRQVTDDHSLVEELVREGKLTADEAAGAKYWTTDLQGKVVDQCVQLHGGYGFMTEYEVSRLWRDARVQRIYGGTNEIMKEIVGRAMGF